VPLLKDRLQDALKALDIPKQEMASELRITPEWLSKILNGHHQGSEDIGLRLEDLLRRRGIESTSIKRDSGNTRIPTAGSGTRRSDKPPRYGLTEPDSGAIEKRMPNRADCEALFRRILDAAEREGSPENVPVLYRLMKKHLASEFPVEE